MQLARAHPRAVFLTGAVGVGHREPDFAERRQAAAEARARVLAGFKPKPYVPAAPEALVVHEDRLEALRAEREAKRLARRTRAAAARPSVGVVAAPIEEPHSEPRPSLPTVYYRAPAVELPSPEEVVKRQAPRPRARAAILEVQEHACYLCGAPFGPHRRPTVEHVVPLSRRGTNKGNRLYACSPCNGLKGDREPHPCELLYLRAAYLRLHAGRA